MTKNSLARTNRAAFQRGLDRYSERQKALLPPTGVGMPVPSQNVRTKLAAVDDPLEPKAKLLATVNYRVDLLEQERANKRISPAAYLTGRILQAAFEKATHVSSSNWRGGDRVDGSLRIDERYERLLGNAEAMNQTMSRLIAKIGSDGAGFLRLILTGERSIQAYAAQEQAEHSRRLGLRRDPGKVSDRAITRVADRLRHLLEVVAEELAATGKARSTIRGEQAAPNPDEDFDEKGRLVAPGEGYRWGDRSDDAAATKGEELASA